MLGRRLVGRLNGVVEEAALLHDRAGVRLQDQLVIEPPSVAVVGDAVTSDLVEQKVDLIVRHQRDRRRSLDAEQGRFDAVAPAELVHQSEVALASTLHKDAFDFAFGAKRHGELHFPKHEAEADRAQGRQGFLGRLFLGLGHRVLLAVGSSTILKIA